MSEIVWESDAQSNGFMVMSNGMVWPDDWPGTLVEAQFTSARGDGADLDRDPDMVPSGPGRVTFTPQVKTVGYDGEHGKRIVSLHPFEAAVGDDGYLYTPGEYGGPGIRGIVLPSNNSDVVDEHDWTWRVTFDIPNTTIRPTHIPTPHDHSVDIKDYLDSDANHGVRVVVDRVAARETLTARDETIAARDLVLPARDQTLAARDEAQAAAAVWVGYDTRLGQIETMAGLEPGEVTDAQTANLISQPDSSTRDALNSGYMPNSILNLAPKPPAGFRGLSVLPTPTIRRTMQGKFTAELDIEALRPTAGVTYYTSPDAPSSGNDGLSPESPMRLASILKNAPDVGTIIYAPGEYFRDRSGVNSPPPKSINHLGDGNVTLTGFNSPRVVTWSQVSGHIYQGTRSATQNIFDVEHLTYWGDYTQYEKMPSLSEITGPGQWAADGSTVYVWAIRNTDLSQAENREQIRLTVTQGLSLVADQGTTHYVEGINFWGAEVISGRGGLIAKNDSLIIAKNCSVKYNLTNGFMTTGGHMITIDCEASSNGRDGFNYHDVEGNGGEFIEIGCHSHHNGRHVGLGTNNATTAHEAVTGIRVNGVYEHTAGPVVADVNDSHTWNLGCVSGGPDFPVTTGQDSSWRTDGRSQIWVDECESHSATTAYTTAGGGIYVHSSGYANEREVGGGSNVRNYTR